MVQRGTLGIGETSKTLPHKQMETTPQDWKNWANYESNKDRFIKEQEEQDDIQESTDSLEEKIEALVENEIKSIKENE